MSKRSIRSFFNPIQVVPAHEKGSDPEAPDPGVGASGEAWGQMAGDSSQQPPVKMAIMKLDVKNVHDYIKCIEYI